MISKIFYASIGGLAAGIVLRSFFNLGLSFALSLSVVAVGVAVFFVIHNAEKPYLLPLVFFLVFSSLGILRFDLALESRVRDMVYETDVRSELYGIVSAEPSLEEGRQRIVIDICEEIACKEKRGRAVLYLELYPRVSYGDMLEVKGELVLPKAFETDSGRVFDYPSYLAKNRIGYQMFYPDVAIIESNRGNFIVSFLFLIKERFLDAIKKQLPSQHAALIAGVTVGAEESLGSELEEDFRKTGIIHIVVLSGYNVTIVAEAVMRFLSFLPFLISIGSAILGIILFTILTGASATIVRASIMAIIALIARATGRSTDVLRALFLAGAIMLLHNPYLLAFDPSFQLSFLATFGLITVSPYVRTRIDYLKIPGSLKELASATIATQLFVLPLLLYMSGEISLVSLPVNILVLPIVPLIMLLGLLISVLSLFFSALSFPFGVAAYVFVGYVFGVVDIFSQLSFATLRVGTFPFWGVALLYGMYAWFLWRKKKPANILLSKT